MADRIKSTLLTQGVPLVWLIWMDRGRMSCMSCASLLHVRCMPLFVRHLVHLAPVVSL